MVVFSLWPVGQIWCLKWLDPVHGRGNQWQAAWPRMPPSVPCAVPLIPSAALPIFSLSPPLQQALFTISTPLPSPPCDRHCFLEVTFFPLFPPLSLTWHPSLSPTFSLPLPCWRAVMSGDAAGVQAPSPFILKMLSSTFMDKCVFSYIYLEQQLFSAWLGVSLDG